jgi:hypothetical protein
MTAPKRIQLSRKRGWRMPENTVKVDRSTKWGNPFIVGEDGDRAECVKLYRMLFTQIAAPAGASIQYLKGLLCLTCKAPLERQKAAQRYVFDHIQQLRGLDLACWCPLDQPCHADVLLELANAPERAE